MAGRKVLGPSKVEHKILTTGEQFLKGRGKVKGKKKKEKNERKKRKKKCGIGSGETDLVLIRGCEDIEAVPNALLQDVPALTGRGGHVPDDRNDIIGFAVLIEATHRPVLVCKRRGQHYVTPRALCPSSSTVRP